MTLVVPFRIATWNIHMARGRDGRRDLDRVIGVLRDLDADCIGLQEVDNHHHPDGDDVSRLAAATGMQPIAGPTMVRDRGDYGNVLLSRWPLRKVVRHDLSVAGREPRGLVTARLDWGGTELGVAVTHLGLRPAERRRQIARLLTLLDGDGPLLLVGDFNEWLPWGRPLRTLQHRFDTVVAPATFPARRPLLRLDRILVRGPLRLDRGGVWSSPLARSASDHLPLTAELTRAPD